MHRMPATSTLTSTRLAWLKISAKSPAQDPSTSDRQPVVTISRASGTTNTLPRIAIGANRPKVQAVSGADTTHAEQDSASSEPKYGPIACPSMSRGRCGGGRAGSACQNSGITVSAPAPVAIPNRRTARTSSR